ncbi:MAG TPA: hypothetical protein DEW46_12265, partial [Verrucomicrobia bacterium]|nr:hypothetical protein [Verrucomicrobiota bacterium]
MDVLPTNIPGRITLFIDTDFLDSLDFLDSDSDTDPDPDFQPGGLWGRPPVISRLNVLEHAITASPTSDLHLAARLR